MSDDNIFNNNVNEGAENNTPNFERPIDENDADKVVTSEPTVTFDSPEPHKKHKNTGLKVFFSMIAVTVALVIALVSGFVLGRSAINSKPQYSNLVDAAPSELTDTATVYKNVVESVVSITVYNDKGDGSNATGLVYSSNGYIVTNDHIYADVVAPRFLVTMYDGTEYSAKFVAGDTRSDLAVLKVEANDLKPVTFRNSDNIIVGEKVAAIGCPSGMLKATATDGIISLEATRISTENSSYTMKTIQTSAPINPGNSGGALVDMSSYVIGVTSAKLSASISYSDIVVYENMGYAIPSNTVVSVVDSLIKNGYVEGRGKLGISYTFIDTVMSNLNDGLKRGLYIAEISQESDLSKTSLQVGDIITHINDIEITSRDIALDIIEAAVPGDSLSFTVYHAKSGETETVYASLLSDKGSSSYSESVLDSNGSQNNNIYDEDADSYSDH